MSCPVNLKSAYKRFLSLTDKELSILSRYRVKSHLMTAELNMIKQFLPSNHPLIEPFLWFLGILKCYAHGANQTNNVWLLYEIGSLVQHSCDPNMLYRNDTGQLVYIAIKPIAKDETLTLSYIGSVYGSTDYRQSRLIKLKLTNCDCALCRMPIDRARRIWCPHCRTKEGTDPGFAVYCGKSSAIRHSQLAVIKQVKKKGL